LNCATRQNEQNAALHTKKTPQTQGRQFITIHQEHGTQQNI